MGLEKRFEVQKYVTKPDRKQLAAMLGLTDAQVRSEGKRQFILEKNSYIPIHTKVISGKLLFQLQSPRKSSL